MITRTLQVSIILLLAFSASGCVWNDTSVTWTEMYHDFEQKQKYGTFESGEKTKLFGDLFTPRKSTGITAGEQSAQSNSSIYQTTGLKDNEDTKYKSRYGSF